MFDAGVGPERVTCSSRGCRADARWAVVWNNPRLHTPDREKVWTACEEHKAALSDYLAARSMLRRVDPLPSEPGSHEAHAPR